LDPYPVDDVAHLFGTADFCIRHTDRSVPAQASVRSRARSRRPDLAQARLVGDELLDGLNRS
jgi:hypothetical protein